MTAKVIPILLNRDRCPVCRKPGPNPHGPFHPLLYHDLMDLNKP